LDIGAYNRCCFTVSEIIVIDIIIAVKLIRHCYALDIVRMHTKQIKNAEDTVKKADTDCKEKLNNTEADIKEKVRASFNSKIWDELSEDCFSCGSCNIVCPTCYCFDVQDEWGLKAQDGTRYRTWDACMTCEFSEVSVQGGSENFRETKADRFRHRFMRKAAYLNEQLGGPACIGCGRCTGACTVNIANPVTVINKIMEQK